MKKTLKRRAFSKFASHILLIGVVMATVLCVGYIATVEHMSTAYKEGCLFYALVLTEIVAFTCFADYIHKTM